MAVSAADAENFVGMPEARYVLAQATVYVSCAPKSDAVFQAVRKAEADVDGKDKKIRVLTFAEETDFISLPVWG